MRVLIKINCALLIKAIKKNSIIQFNFLSGSFVERLVDLTGAGDKLILYCPHAVALSRLPVFPGEWTCSISDVTGMGGWWTCL